METKNSADSTTRESEFSTAVRNYLSRGLRPMEPIEYWARKYFLREISPLILEEVKEETVVSRAQARETVRRHVIQAWLDQNEETRLKSARELTSLKEQVGWKVIAKGPSDYAQSLLDLPSVLKDVANMIREATGFNVTILAGGPLPQQHGLPVVFTEHCGADIHGHTFPEYLYVSDSTGTISEHDGLEKFREFVTNSFPPSVCQSRALIPNDLDEVTLEELIEVVFEGRLESLTADNAIKSLVKYYPRTPRDDPISLALAVSSVIKNGFPTSPQTPPELSPTVSPSSEAAIIHRSASRITYHAEPTPIDLNQILLNYDLEDSETDNADDLCEMWDADVSEISDNDGDKPIGTSRLPDSVGKGKSRKGNNPPLRKRRDGGSGQKSGKRAVVRMNTQRRSSGQTSKNINLSFKRKRTVGDEISASNPVNHHVQENMRRQPIRERRPPQSKEVISLVERRQRMAEQRSMDV